MLNAISFSIGCLIILAFLTTVYFLKSKRILFKNVIFRWLLITLIITMILEIISLKTIYYRDAIPIINSIVCRSSYFIAIAWLILLCGFLFGIGKKYNYSTLYEYYKNEKIYKILFYVWIVDEILFLILPFEYTTVSNYGYVRGLAVYLTYLTGICVVFIAGVLFFKNIKNVSKRQYGAIGIIIFESLTVVPLQLVYPHILFVTGSFALKLFVVYFALENPDLYVIDEVDEERQKIQKSNQAKSEFLSNMSQEIRNPIKSIISFSESLMNSDNLDIAEAKKSVAQIYSEGQILLDAMDNILDISKIETDIETLDNKEYDFKNLINNLTSIIDSRINKQKVKFDLDIDSEIPSKLIGDKSKLYQILINILSNAVKYTEVGKIRFKIKKQINKDDILLTFIVSDTGYGIKKEDYDKLFEKFSRLNSAREKEIEGTGLGLVVTKRLVELSGGKIWFDSEYAAGTTFYVEISQKIASNTTIGNLTIEEHNNKPNYIDCSKYKILIVEDNELNLKVTKRLLSPYKFQTEYISSGKECINKIKLGEQYDMILLDHMMKEIDGIAVLKVLRKLHDYDIPPVIAMTANAMYGMRELYLKEGFDDYISKPISINELNKLIIKYFSNNS